MSFANKNLGRRKRKQRRGIESVCHMDSGLPGRENEDMVEDCGTVGDRTLNNGGCYNQIV